MEISENIQRTDLGILDNYARFLDSSIRIPGTKWSFGLDPILGLIPGFGAVAGYGFSALILIKILQLGASKRLIVNMFANISLDALIGFIPVLGILFDFVFKANERNLKLFREYHDEGKHSGSILPYLIALLVFGLGMILVMTYMLYQAMTWSF